MSQSGIFELPRVLTLRYRSVRKPNPWGRGPVLIGNCENGAEHDFKLGQRRAVVSLGPRFHDSRHAGVWLVDEPYPARPDRFFYRSIHADIGYVVLLFTVLRLIWRGFNPTPALPSAMPRWQRIAAHISHGAIYVAIILVTMLGWAHSGARTPDYSSWFGLFHVPQITSPDKAAADAYEERHIFFAYVLLALIVVHLAGAAWHHFVKRDRVTARMIDGAPG